MPRKKKPNNATLLEVRLDADSVVNRRTGAVESPAEYVENLRLLERRISEADAEILVTAQSLKDLRATRESIVAALRSAVREGAVLPLLEAIEEIDAEKPPAA